MFLSFLPPETPHILTQPNSDLPGKKNLPTTVREYYTLNAGSRGRTWKIVIVGNKVTELLEGAGIKD